MSELDPLHAISVPQPEFSETQAKAVLAEKFGLQGELRSLVSERDQNFRVTTADGEQFVFKIANRAEPNESTDFQIKALLHIEHSGCEVPTPRVRRTNDGADSATIADGDCDYLCRVVSFLPGELLSNTDTTPELARHFGECAAQLDFALAGFEHAGQTQSLLWDLQQASQLRDILHYIEDDAVRNAATASLNDFDKRVVPALPQLRRQVIHSDLHGDNVLAEANRIVGVIDFGDMLDAPLVMEVAVAAAYLRPDEHEPDILALIGPFVGAYHSVFAVDRRRDRFVVRPGARATGRNDIDPVLASGDAWCGRRVQQPESERRGRCRGLPVAAYRPRSSRVRTAAKKVYVNQAVKRPAEMPHGAGVNS